MRGAVGACRPRRSVRAEDPQRMMTTLGEFGFFAAAPLWLAAALLVGGGGLLAWPMLARRVRRMREAAMSRHVPTVEERVAIVESAAKHRDELERLIYEARETIRAGCAMLDARLARLDSLEKEDGPEVRVMSVKPAAAASRESEDPRVREVYALADQGLGAFEIATKLGEHVGKVELMLALRRA